MTFHFFLLSFIFLCFILFICHQIFRDILFPDANHDDWHKKRMFSIGKIANLQMAVLNYLFVNRNGFDDSNEQHVVEIACQFRERAMSEYVVDNSIFHSSLKWSKSNTYSLWLRIEALFFFLPSHQFIIFVT